MESQAVARFSISNIWDVFVLKKNDLKFKFNYIPYILFDKTDHKVS